MSSDDVGLSMGVPHTLTHTHTHTHTSSSLNDLAEKAAKGDADKSLFVTNALRHMTDRLLQTDSGQFVLLRY